MFGFPGTTGRYRGAPRGGWRWSTSYRSCDGCCQLTPECVPILDDPAFVRAARNPKKKGMIKIHGRFVPKTDVDPIADGFRFLLTNEFGTIFDGTLLPGDLAPSGTTNWKFKDRSAKKSATPLRDGLFAIKIRKRNDREGIAYGFRVQAWGDMSAATVPLMVTQVYMGDDVAVLKAEWDGEPGRWYLKRKDFVPSLPPPPPL